MKLRKVEPGLVELDTIPMLCIVFQLLMFFMIVMSFENTKAEERKKLPVVAVARPPTVKSEHELVLNFGYQRDSLGGRLKPFPEIFYHDQYIDIRQISVNLQQERRVTERLHGKNALSDVTVLIRAQAEVPAGLVQDLIRICQDAGFTKFSLRTAAARS